LNEQIRTAKQNAHERDSLGWRDEEENQKKKNEKE
jgi:hypothetical protein